ncbi:MAG: hypothetical protein NC548_31990 [Lachnospiraceae bacterium]|nr:hypothetical protein [Lachnospiraceae bacterium]
MKTLQQKTQEVERERERRYPLWDYPDNRAEIRKISERAMELLYTGKDPLRPDVENIGFWDVIPAVTVEVLQSLVNYLIAHKSVDVSEVSFKFGKLFEIGIQYMVIREAENANTFNPKIKVLDELRFDMADIPYDDAVPADIGETLREEKSEYLPIQFFEERETLYEIVKGLISHPNGQDGQLMMKYGITLLDWTLLYSIVVAFFRAGKEFLIEHKDDEGVGVVLKIGRLIDFGISKNGPDDDPDYDIFVEAGQVFKVDQKDNEGGDRGVR